MQRFFHWFSNLDWSRLLPEFIGKSLGVLIGFLIGWYLVIRRQAKDFQKFQRGESDEVLFQAHYLVPVPGTDEITLVFRNLGPRTTVNQLYDNEGARKLVRKLINETTMDDPILKTGGGRTAFEITNIALSYIAGEMATAPFARKTWLFVMTCEDREVVHKQCIRCFIILPEDLAQFKDWKWCTTKVRVEKIWHAFRIVALHRIAMAWEEEEEYFNQQRKQEAKLVQMPMLDQTMRHERIRRLSLGVYPDEMPITEPRVVPWVDFLDRLKQMGLDIQEPTPGENTTDDRAG